MCVKYYFLILSTESKTYSFASQMLEHVSHLVQILFKIKEFSLKKKNIIKSKNL